MSDQKLHNVRHSLAHLLAIAVLEKDPQAKLAIGPVIDNGFYYDFSLTKTIGDNELKDLEKKMKKLIGAKVDFEGCEISYEEAKSMFANQPYKLEILEDLKKNGDKITVYKTGDFTDLCRGGHVQNTKEINPDGFRLERVAGAYWRGDEKQEMLTRIYGLAFETKDDLDEYEKMIEEAKKRDHRKIGKEMDLFVFSDLVGPGLPLWTPNGTIVREELNNFVWELREKHDYQKVEIPHITKKALYETSGHWQKFAEELFKIKSREGHEYAMKPMNCPHHTQIYSHLQRSYRELPHRYANTTMVYRDEQSGELSGLSRVLCITQDDAHVFCRKSQLKEEFFKIWEIVEKFYSVFGFELNVRLSFHNPETPEKYLGTPEIWETAENTLIEIAKEKGVSYITAPGEAALYGPKIDFLSKDSLGRTWQVATIQLDMNLPERFDLYCINEKSEKERIVMIHAAVMGSIERFMSVLIEHLAGNFPLWLSPKQVQIIPINEKHNEYSRSIYMALKDKKVRVSINDNDENLSKKIKNAKQSKVPYILVVGDKEMETNTVTIEKRGGETIKNISKEEIVVKIVEEISSKK